MPVSGAMMDICAGEDAQHPVVSGSLTHISYLVASIMIMMLPMSSLKIRG